MTLLNVGQQAPDFTLSAADSSTLTLHDLRGGNVIVYFYPAAMTPGCTTQACDFRDNWNRLTHAGYTVVGISPDTPDSLTQFTERDNLNFTLLSDPDHQVMEQWGAWGEKTLYGKKSIGVIRSTFVVDPQGILTLVKYNVRAKGHVDWLMKQLSL